MRGWKYGNPTPVDGVADIELLNLIINADQFINSVRLE